MQISQSCKSARDLSMSTMEFVNGCRKFNVCLGPSDVGTTESAGLAHDAGNILGALSLYAELLAIPGVLSTEYQSYAEEIRLLAERSNILIERLAGYTREPDSDIQTAILPQVVANYKRLLSRIIRRPFEITILPDSAYPIGVSREIIERILVNLVKNAAAATPKAGRISVIIEGSNDTDEYGRRRIVMTVRDAGSGMSKSQADKLRGLVWNSKTSKRGLGLHIVRELVAESGGYLDVTSHPGCGTTVSVTWFEVRANAA